MDWWSLHNFKEIRKKLTTSKNWKPRLRKLILIRSTSEGKIDDGEGIGKIEIEVRRS
jgi:hypothetical protein